MKAFEFDENPSLKAAQESVIRRKDIKLRILGIQSAAQAAKVLPQGRERDQAVLSVQESVEKLHEDIRLEASSVMLGDVYQEVKKLGEQIGSDGFRRMSDDESIEELAARGAEFRRDADITAQSQVKETESKASLASRAWAGLKAFWRAFLAVVTFPFRKAYQGMSALGSAIASGWRRLTSSSSKQQSQPAQDASSSANFEQSTAAEREPLVQQQDEKGASSQQQTQSQKESREAVEQRVVASTVNSGGAASAILERGKKLDQVQDLSLAMNRNSGDFNQAAARLGKATEYAENYNKSSGWRKFKAGIGFGMSLAEAGKKVQEQEQKAEHSQNGELDTSRSDYPPKGIGEFPPGVARSASSGKGAGAQIRRRAPARMSKEERQRRTAQIKSKYSMGKADKGKGSSGAEQSQEAGKGSPCAP